MLELTGLGTVLRVLGFLYWALAIGLLALALWKGKNWWRKLIWSAVVIAVFGYLPAKMALENYRYNLFAKEAWAYFKKLCDEQSGEKIYKTFTGVKSVLVIKPLPPATDADHFDQFWFGDPYSGSATSRRAERAATLLTMYSSGPNGRRKGLDFVELKNDGGFGYTRITRPLSNRELALKEQIQVPASRFGILWEDISTRGDRKYWVAGSRLRVIDLRDNSVIAERVGYFIEAGFGSTSGGRRPWLTSRGPNTTCPPLSGGDYSDNWFITSVFKQDEER